MASCDLSNQWVDLLPDGRPALMGIVNVTPDSFSDGGQFYEVQDAINHVQKLISAGADIIDIGGESTRPGAAPVTPKEELRRTMGPLAYAVETGTLVSIDTRNAAVMRGALHHRDTVIINDVSALRHDSKSIELVIREQPPVILMHMAGEPATMNDDPHYDDIVADVINWLAARAEFCIAAGLDRGCIALDPGLGFGKAHAHDLALLNNLDRIVDLGFPVCMGASRKLTGWSATPTAKLVVSTTAAVIAAMKGAAILRVHDVAETRGALRVAGYDMS